MAHFRACVFHVWLSQVQQRPLTREINKDRERVEDRSLSADFFTITDTALPEPLRESWESVTTPCGVMCNYSTLQFLPGRLIVLVERK